MIPSKGKKNVRSLTRGAVSALNIKPKSGSKSVRVAIAGDWKTVGRDLRVGAAYVLRNKKLSDRRKE